ncbi:MAG: 2-polyprenyl-6-hydroxyphenyl methylase/3-demethylubiquinone-9 3-methyltransferase [Francisellaceae bacterium]|jgi:2-polyprenyl-6-hydroxyphenyl methylase/3-demethylubiquinone-9 3-methyltransferase
MNVDQKEIEKFSALSHRWWDKEGEMKALHDINPLRMDFIKKNIADINNKLVLDIGCGAGILTESLAQAGAKTTGIDLAEDSIDIAKLHALESNSDIDYQTISVENFAESHKNIFDVITCMEMLEHVPDPSSIVSACISMLKPNGYIFLSTLNRNLKSYMMAILGAEYFLKIIPKGTHQYDRFIKPSEMCNWLDNLHCPAIDSTGIHYNPLSQVYSLGQNIDVNYIICAKKNETS